MKKPESSFKNMLLSLVGVTVVAVGLLAVVNELTRGPIAAADMRALNRALAGVVPRFDNNPVAESDTIVTGQGGAGATFIIYPARFQGEPVGAAVRATSMGFSGELVVLVGFDALGRIYNYALLSHSETPGLGSKADRWFMAGERGDITGINPGTTPLAVRNDGGQIDAITASTVTTRAFLRAVNAAYAIYRGNPDGATSASPKVDTNTSATQQVDANTSATNKQEGASNDE